MSKHTPGFNRVVKLSLDGFVIKTDGGTEVARMLGGPLDSAEAGNLLCAAPEMLEALKKCEDELSQIRDNLPNKTDGDHYRLTALIETAIAAIAKVEGWSK